MGIGVSTGNIIHVDYKFTFATANLTKGVAIGGYVPKTGDLLLPGSGFDLITPWTCTGNALAGLYVSSATHPFTLVAGTNYGTLKGTVAIANHGVRGLLGLTTTQSKPVAVDLAGTAVTLYASSTGAKFVAATINGTAAPTYPVVVSATSTANHVTLTGTTYISVVAAGSYANKTTLLAALNAAPAASTKTAISTVLTFTAQATGKLVVSGGTGKKGGVGFNTKKLTSTNSTALVTALKLKTRALTGGVATPITTPTAGLAVAHLLVVTPQPAA